MKKLFTFLAMMPLAAQVYGQAITIASTDMPVPTTYYYLNVFSSAPVPAAGTGSAWNYGTYTGAIDTTFYVTETDTFFTNAGIQTHRARTKILTTGYAYNLNAEYAFTTASVAETGINIPYQPYSLAGFTGVATDSLNIPAQKALLSTPEILNIFPCTMSSSWSSVSRRITNFYLTVGAAGLDNAPSQQVYYMYRTDTVMGWGTAVVYTSGGPSMPYGVLMDKIAEYAVDSFYIGGAPAPTSLLSGFGITQGEKTDSNLRYNFYRKGSFDYLMSFYFANDPTYSVTSGEYVDTANIIAADAGVNNVQNTVFTTVLYPNPSNGSEINILFYGKNVTDCKYYITDIAGSTVQSGSPTTIAPGIHIGLDSKLANGNYVINITDNENNKIVAQQFIIAK